MIGPVQPFIESARTLRDLWAGSYLLSWLTAAAMQPILEEEDCGHTAFITPHVDEKNPLLKAMRRTGMGKPESTLPSLPNKFAAEIPRERGELLRTQCIDRLRAEWQAIGAAVRTELDRVHKDLGLAPEGSDPANEWSRSWTAQLEDFFEIRCVVQPYDSQAGWDSQWKRLNALLEMTRSVRHVPEYAPIPGADGRFPVKCALLGTVEQMGPADLNASKAYWAKLHTDWNGLNGTRLQTSDRLCAVSLVKRFAWPAYFAGSTAGNRGRLGLDVRTLRYSDTATIAAARWLAEGDPIRPYEEFKRDRWSGQWLHWATPSLKDEDPCPESTWNRVQAKRKSQGKPPTYYAILHMDGDNMGRLFQGEGPKAWGAGQDRCREITRRMTSYSLERVEPLVVEHDGELIYAGGDDVLALLPTATAIECAAALRRAFRRDDVLGADASASAGIAIVHYKEDLRNALDVARRSEKAAKRISTDALPDPERPHDPPRKDALAVTVCRHSGEHSLCVMGWAQSELLGALVQDFQGVAGPEAPDRWAYKLRDELPVLTGLPQKAVQTELGRLLKRTESAPAGFRERVMSLYDSYLLEMTSPDRNWSRRQALEGFATICQTASFLARGSE